MAATSDVAHFEAATRFSGARVGTVFKLGPRGLGYYADVGSHAAAESAELERFHSDLGEGGGASSEAAAASPDAPILAAIRSHNSGLDEVEAKTAKLEAEAGNYIRQSGLKHAA